MKRVAVLMGSKSDLETMSEATKVLDKFGLSYEITILSAHRTPDLVAQFAKNAHSKGFRVLIAGAGGAAHLPGMVAAYTHLPVIGVPVPIGPLHGKDALYSIVQMPKGIPVATMAIGGAWNAGILAAQILATGDPALSKKLLNYKTEMQLSVEKDAKETRKTKSTK